VLNIGSLICCLGLSLIAPFYPTYAERFDISKTLLGLIFAINPIGGFIASLIVGKLLN
jgi:MFS family permease